MGLTLYPRSCQVVSDTPLHDAQCIYEPKEPDSTALLTPETLTNPSSTILCHPPLLPSPRPSEPVSNPLGDLQASKERDTHVPSSTALYNSPLLSSLSHSEPASDPLQKDAQLVDEPKQRDPHVLPIFTSESLANPSSTVLYLPPFLSSLPHELPVTSVSTDRPPLVTETRLPDIDPVSHSLHKALHHFRPLSEDYAGLPYALAFNWSELELPEEEEREWYAVVFRSRRKKGSDSGPLYDADRQAHEEAVSNGGLIMYWYGIPNAETGMNLATCIWQSRKHAIAANSRPHHIRAMKLAAASYEIYDLERYKLSKVKGEKGLLVEDFSGGECGW